VCTEDNNVIQRFLKGMSRFKERFYENDSELMRQLAELGQHPEVLLISCSDSRVDPALLTGANPGELFIVRNVANLVPPFHLGDQQDGARAAIEYAVRDLKVKHIIVLGHAHCGGIKALLGTLKGDKLNRDFIGAWVSIAYDACYKYIIEPIRSKQGSNLSLKSQEDELSSIMEHHHLAERAIIQGSISNLETYPWIMERLNSGQLTLHGWWFDLETGDLWCTDEDNKVFLPMLE